MFYDLKQSKFTFPFDLTPYKLLLKRRLMAIFKIFVFLFFRTQEIVRVEPEALPD